MFAKKIPYLLMITLLAGLFALPVNGANDYRYRVAVLPFDDGSIQKRWWGHRWEVGKGVADELVTALLDTGKFRLVEREQIARVLREQDLGSHGRVDSATAARIGKILGVHYLIMGKVTEFTANSRGATIAIPRSYFGLGVKSSNARVAIDARMVDASTAEIQYAVTGTGEKKQTSVEVAVDWDVMGFGSSEFKKTYLGYALRDAVESVADQFSTKLYGDDGSSRPEISNYSGWVADIFDKKVYITLDTTDDLKPGMRLTVHHLIRTVKNPQTGDVIDSITEPIAEIEVTEVRERSAICEVVSRLDRHYKIEVNDLVKLNEP